MRRIALLAALMAIAGIANAAWAFWVAMDAQALGAFLAGGVSCISAASLIESAIKFRQL